MPSDDCINSMMGDVGAAPTSDPEAAAEAIELGRLIRSLPVDVNAKVSLHDLKRICDNYNSDMNKPCTTWLRCRFHANEDDPRPVSWPPPGPYWCTGYGEDHSVIVAYVRSFGQVKQYWPEATEIESDECDKIEYSDRFQKPDWYTE